MQAKMPALAVTENGFGWWCESDDVKTFGKRIEEVCKTDRSEIGESLGSI